MVCRLFYIFWLFQNDVPFVPTPRRIIKKMALAAKSHTNKPLRKIIDLGSGTGKMLFHLAGILPAPVVFYGIEQSWLLYAAACARSFFSRNKKRIVFLRDDWSNHSLESYDAVFVFLTNAGMSALLSKFSSELVSGAVIVAYMFPLPENNTFDEYRYNYKKSLGRIFVYVKR